MFGENGGDVLGIFDCKYLVEYLLKLLLLLVNGIEMDFFFVVVVMSVNGSVAGPGVVSGGGGS